MPETVAVVVTVAVTVGVTVVVVVYLGVGVVVGVEVGRAFGPEEVQRELEQPRITRLPAKAKSSKPRIFFIDSPLNNIDLWRSGITAPTPID
jgi:hypothetical protein